MPLKRIMDLRQEFVRLAAQEGSNIRALCRRYGISPTTGYRYLARWRAEGVDGLADRSRRPQGSPRTTSSVIAAAVLEKPPAPSTITAILRRQGRLAPPVRAGHGGQRFEHPQPNDLWQLDFMGQPELPTGHVHPLTLLDDHSRCALLVAACPHQQQKLVQELLTEAFRRYGLPRRILTDNGPPWGTAGSPGLSALEAWWLRLGIAVSHDRPNHPQTQGKLERLHRTLWAETVGIRELRDLATAQRRFDAFRQVYNLERPHEALASAVPADRYQPSPRSFPEHLPPIVYGPDDAVRQVYHPGRRSFRGQQHFISHGLIGLSVAVRPTRQEGVFAICYCHRQVATIDLTERSSGVHDVSAHLFTISPVYTRTGRGALHCPVSRAMSPRTGRFAYTSPCQAVHRERGWGEGFSGRSMP